MAQKKSTLPIVEPAESTIHDQPAPNKSVGGRKKRARRLKKTAKKQAESQKRKRAKTDLDGGSEDDVQLTAKKRNIGVCLNLEPLNLLCGWTDCKYSSTNYAEFTEHALDHANQIIKSKGSFQCQWNDCTYKTSDQLVFECHSSYHPYFEKLKCIGKNVRERLNLAVCNFNLVDAIPVFMAPFQCDWDSCNDYFTKVQMFFDHVMCHVNGVPKLDSNELLSCCWLGCRESFKSVHKLKEHTGSHIRIKVAACPQCNRTFASKTKFQDHCRRHDNDAGDQFQCSQCLKVLTTERLLREHVRLHVNHYKCHLCDMTCTTPATLSRHIRYRHLSERPFKCEYCQHGCVTKRDLRVHMRTHFADKLFECDECDFKCRSMFGLKGHFVKEHKPPDVDHRLYACHCCSKRFSRGSLLTSHLLKFHNFRWPSGHSRFRFPPNRMRYIIMIRVTPRGGIHQVEDVQDFEHLHVVGEAEEGEMGTDTLKEDDTIIKPHSFWRDKLGPQEIREAQARMMLQYMDLNIDPCEDFYLFACGNWAASNPIPPDKAGYDTFEMLRESLDSVLRDLLLEPEEDYNFHNAKINLDADNTVHETEDRDIAQTKVLQSNDDAIVKAKHLFHSCMDYDILKKRGHSPLLELLSKLGGWPLLDPSWDPTTFDWIDLVSRLRLYNNDILISEWVGPDIKNSDEYVIQLDQTSLGLPTRDYFLSSTNARYLHAYREYLLRIVILLGADANTAATDADDIVLFETNLARITASPEDRRNVSELYRRMSIGELRKTIPQIDWIRYFTKVLNRHPNHSEPVVCFALTYFQDLVSLLGITSPRTIANYLLWRFVRHRVNNLDDRFQDAKQRFYFVLFGRERSPPRWQNCVAQVNSNMGMAVGSLFVQKYFDEVSKNDTLQMTGEIQQSFREILSETSWLDAETRNLAALKIDAMRLRIGYPDFILDRSQLARRYYDVEINPATYFENTLSILQHLTRSEQARLGQPVNKTLWNTAPAVVNAYYSRNKNQISR